MSQYYKSSPTHTYKGVSKYIHPINNNNNRSKIDVTKYAKIQQNKNIKSLDNARNHNNSVDDNKEKLNNKNNNINNINNINNNIDIDSTSSKSDNENTKPQLKHQKSTYFVKKIDPSNNTGNKDLIKSISQKYIPKVAKINSNKTNNITSSRINNINISKNKDINVPKNNSTGTSKNNTISSNKTDGQIIQQSQSSSIENKNINTRFQRATSFNLRQNLAKNYKDNQVNNDKIQHKLLISPFFSINIRDDFKIYYNNNTKELVLELKNKENDNDLTSYKIKLVDGEKIYLPDELRDGNSNNIRSDYSIKREKKHKKSKSETIDDNIIDIPFKNKTKSEFKQTDCGCSIKRSESDQKISKKKRKSKKGKKIIENVLEEKTEDDDIMSSAENIKNEQDNDDKVVEKEKMKNNDNNKKDKIIDEKNNDEIIDEISIKSNEVINEALNELESFINNKK